jgi:hypothetical protein
MHSQTDSQKLLAAYVSGLFAFAPIYFFILNHFYNTGAFFMDAGWYADLMHQHWSLPNPKVILISDKYPPYSFYGNHISPFLSLIAILSNALSLNRVQVFAVYNGAAHGLLAFYLCLILMRWVPLTTFSRMIVSCVLAVAFSLNGLAINIASYPHFVMLIPALLLGCLYFLLAGRIALAATIGAIALLLREDVGFHLVAMLSVFVFFNLLNGQTIRSQKTFVIFLVSALGYSCVALSAQKLFFAFDQFSYVYGKPPFVHMTSELVLRRLTDIIDNRQYIWIPMALIIVASIIYRAPLVIVGIIAFLPWMALQFLAVSDIPGTLQALYAYPLLLIFVWLVIGLIWNSPKSTLSATTRIAYIALVLAASLLTNPQVPGFFQASIPTQITLHPGRIEKFVAALSQSLPTFSNVRADASIISLIPESFSVDAWLHPQDWVREPPSNNVQLLAYFRTGYEYPKAAAQEKLMYDPHVYELPQTNIIVVTSGPLNSQSPMMPLLKASQ